MPVHREDISAPDSGDAITANVANLNSGGGGGGNHLDTYTDEKNLDEITPAGELEKDQDTVREGGQITRENRARLMQYYGRKAEEDDIAPSRDVQMIMDRIIEMSDEEALEVLVEAMEFHKIDPNFPSWTMAKLKMLVQGYKACEMSEDDWSFDLKTEAAMLKYHSPYPEVRAVTDPYDDPTQPVETIRSYVLGFGFMAGSTALNTFFSPRQPAISLAAIVMQLLLAPCGWFWAKVMPNWHIKIWKWRIPINHGPWSYKEQCFSTILFTIVNGAGGAYGLYLAQMMPQFFDLHWLNWGYEIILALAMQAFGFAYAGIVRRLVIFPVNAIWPSVLPTLALNRALVVPEKKETINGWKLSRYHFFLLCFGAMFVWFWIPNELFAALHGFNWMTWIAPENYPLAMITGFYGGMGFNPIATFDWNVAGTTSLVTPWFSEVQQYICRVLSGLIIIGMHWSNAYWSAYMPINSNQTFNNKGESYNASIILGDDLRVDIEKYKAYGPPYFSGANMFGQGAWYGWYMLSLTYIGIRHWTPISRAVRGMWRGVRNRQSVYAEHSDPHSRMMAQYKEVPDWWYGCILIFCITFGLIGMLAWPTQCPWWSIFAVLILNIIFLVPSTVIVSYSNLRMDSGLLFQMLAGVWYAGNPQGLMVAQNFGTQFGVQTDNFVSDLKIGHYAKLPPRAVFRGQIFSVILNCFIWIAMMNWMVTNFQPGSFCNWDNKQHMVCANVHASYSLTVMYGGFGVKNMFKLYPILPWVFLIAPVIGITWACTQKFGPGFRERALANWSEAKYARWDKWLFRPIAKLSWFDPSVSWHGALTWTGGNNLSYATQGVVISYIFMNYLRRHYSAWWQKYNYLLEAGFDLGVAISGIIQVLIFGFGNGGKGYSLHWWGNDIGYAGVDYRSYNQNATLLPIPEKGYFGLDPEDYPMEF